MPKINVIGIGYRPLDPKASEALLASTVVLASNRLMEVFPSYAEYPVVQDRLKIINNVDDVMDFMATTIALDSNAIIGLIASGDPMFHGIGKRTLDRFGPVIVEILPDLSAVQLASARTRLSWDNALLVSLHGGPNPEKRRKLPYERTDLPHLLARHHTLFILTDRENNPALIAETLAASETCRAMTITMHVCEQLGYPTERITSGTPAGIAGNSYRDPNIVVLHKSGESVPPPTPLLGLTEDSLAHSRGMITKDEVRAVSLHKLALPPTGVIWDIGAGSGAVSVEIARLAPGLTVYAVEKDAVQLAHIEANRATFMAENMQPVLGIAPEALADLPNPDRVFIGGSGGNMEAILSQVSERMRKGIIVVNAAQMETLNTALAALRKSGFRTNACQVSVSRMRELGGGNSLEAHNPVFVIRGER